MIFKKTLFLLLIFLINSCSKDDLNSDSYVSIPSPYLEEFLINEGIDSEGVLDQRILKSDIENIQELDIIIELNKEAADFSELNCKNLKYNYDLVNNDLLSGINNFKDLKKIALIIRPRKINSYNFATCELNFYTLPNGQTIQERNLDVSVEITGLDKLEQVHFSNLNSFEQSLTLKIANCSSVKKIGTANSFYKIENIPFNDLSIMRIDETNFTTIDSPEPSYHFFLDNLFVSNKQSTGVILELENLQELTSLHINDSYFLEPIKINNCPKLKRLFFFSQRELNFSSIENVFFDDLEEFYFKTLNSCHDFPECGLIGPNDFIYDLSNARKINKIVQSLSFNGITWDAEKFGFSIKNNANLSNNLSVKLIFNNKLLETNAVDQTDIQYLNVCLDNDITDDFLLNNILIESPFGAFDGNDIITNCN